MANDKVKKEKPEKTKVHVCSVCGRPSDATICHACEDKIRGEALEQRHEVDKAGRTDTNRR